MSKLNALGGCPSPKDVEPNTIRMTVQVEVPYSNELMNYNDKTLQLFKDFINSDKFTSMGVEAGPAVGRELE